MFPNREDIRLQKTPWILLDKDFGQVNKHAPNPTNLKHIPINIPAFHNDLYPISLL